MSLDSHVWWYLSRASGLVSWAAVSFSAVLGMLLRAKVIKGASRPAWITAVHRHLALLSIVALATHILALLADTYVQFSWRDLLIPGASTWKPVATGLGVAALWLLAVVQVCALVLSRESRVWWTRVHMLSYGVLLLTFLHAVFAGTDARTLWFTTLAGAVGALVVATFAIRTTLVMRPNRTISLPPERTLKH